MNAIIRKWGNSPAIRLPSAVLKAAGYRLNQRVELVVSRSRIDIRPSSTVEYDLEELVSGINADNIHAEVCFDEPSAP